MRPPLAAALILALLFATPAHAATGTPPHGPAVSWPPEILAQRAEVARLRPHALLAAYPEAELELAHRYLEAGHPSEALASATAAAGAADRILELHKSLSETILPYEQARGERAAAREAGMLRDRATFFAAGVARTLGRSDLAISDYVQVVSSQPDSALAQEAETALRQLGFLASPLPEAAGSPRP